MAFSLARRLRAGETVFSAWSVLPAPLIAETLAREGFAAVTLDQQHGFHDIAGIARAITGVHLAGAAPIVRVPLNDFATASRALDFGAEAVIAPMINTPAQAHAFAAAAKFPPLGERSWGAQRAMALSGLSDPQAYLHEANALTIAFAMIETEAALDNVEAIAATKGIDALFVGPSDLSIALSGGTLDPHAKEVEAALGRVLAAARKEKKIAGLYCADVARARLGAERGFTFLAVGSDLSLLRAGAAAQAKALRT